MARPGTLPRGITLYRGRYRVRLTVDGETHALGMFDALVDAKAALAIAKGEAVRGAFVPPSELRARRRQEVERERVESVTVAEGTEVWLAEVAAKPEAVAVDGGQLPVRAAQPRAPTLGEVRVGNDCSGATSGRRMVCA